MGPVAALSLVLFLALALARPAAGGISEEDSTCVARGYVSSDEGYEWWAKEPLRRMAQVNWGDRSRLRAAMDRYLKLEPGQNFTVAFVGGSITGGQGAIDAPAFPYWTEQILQATMGKNVVVHNGAVPGTLSSYMSVCHHIHVNKEADIIFVEYSLNDASNAVPEVNNAVRRPFERLLRKLLLYKKRPAVVLVHAYMWIRIIHPLEVLKPGTYWDSSEREMHEFGLYYGLPELSVKAAVHRQMQLGTEGFIVSGTRGNHEGRMRPLDEDKDLKGRMFYWDNVHPDGNTGHRFMGEMVAQFILDALASSRAVPATPEDFAGAAEDLPPPMLPDNWQSASEKCFIGSALRTAVLDQGGWEYKDEGKDKMRPKLGFISETVGSTIKFLVNTTASSGMDGMVTMEISYLRSYENMGQGRVVCGGGCKCPPTIFDGHHTAHNSQLYLHEVHVTQASSCEVSVTVLEETHSPSGNHKVKVAGIMLTEEGNENGIKNFGAIQMAVEGANSGEGEDGGTFEIRNWMGRGGRSRMVMEEGVGRPRTLVHYEQ